MVFGVLWVGVDLGLCLKDEPRLARLLDDVGFRDTTGSGARVRTLGRTVLFDGENAARLHTYERDISGPLRDFRYQSWMYGPFAGFKYSF